MPRTFYAAVGSIVVILAVVAPVGGSAVADDKGPTLPYVDAEMVTAPLDVQSTA
ncbi:hypothetical protein ACLQ18_43465 [Streptomyces sp. DT193]|uniref:hypothetical protein n=1 Tax=Streptomyces sp. DT193 TaxID=3393418 RepID=UPI003CE93288